MTLADMLSQTQQRLNYGASPDATVIARLTAYLNETQQEIMSEPGLTRLKRGSLPFTSVTNQSEYAMAACVSRINFIRDTTNMRKLDVMDEGFYRTILPDPTRQNGTPSAWVPLGLGPVALRPSDASTIYAKSSAAGDTAQTLYWEAVTAGGYVRTGSVVLTGTTAVAISSTVTDIIQVTNLYLSAVCAGTVSLLEDSGAGAVLSTIGIGKTSEVFQRFALYATPASGLTYVVDYELEANNLINANDTPVIPPRFNRTLCTGARMKEYEFKNDISRRLVAEKEFKKDLGQINYFIVCQPDQVWVPGRPAPGSSVLGPWYPASSYRG